MAAPKHGWLFPARLIRVVDGDTVHLECDLGFQISSAVDFRLLGINAPELHGPTAAAGKAAKAYAEAWFTAAWVVGAGVFDWPFMVESRKSVDLDKYGRWLAVIWRVADGASLNADLVSSGNAVPYMAT